ncbi:MAG: siderophore-interacting protein [Burkholderiales bacterium]
MSDSAAPQSSTATSPAPRRVRPRPQYRAVEVKNAVLITPQMRRITVSGAALAGFSTQGVAGHVRVLLPAPGQEAPVPPEWGPEGPVYQEGVPRPTSRAYTPRRWSEAEQELDIDFVLHGDNGPASAWAARAKPGDKLVVVAPRRAYQPDPTAAWHLIAGDESALPAIATILEVLPATTWAIVYIEIDNPKEEQPLRSAARLQIHWVHRRGAVPGVKLEAAVRQVSFPMGKGCAWVACEAMVMRNIRKYLLSERGMERAAINTQGYWKLGAANHPDHDTGEDV